MSKLIESLKDILPKLNEPTLAFWIKSDAIPATPWIHFAFVKSATKWSVYRNGVFVKNTNTPYKTIMEYEPKWGI